MLCSEAGSDSITLPFPGHSMNSFVAFPGVSGGEDSTGGCAADVQEKACQPCLSGGGEARPQVCRDFQLIQEAYVDVGNIPGTG